MLDKYARALTFQNFWEKNFACVLFVLHGFRRVLLLVPSYRLRVDGCGLRVRGYSPHFPEMTAMQCPALCLSVAHVVAVNTPLVEHLRGCESDKGKAG